MYRFLLFFTSVLLLSSCASNKAIELKDEQIKYSYNTDSLKYSFQVLRDGKVTYVGSTGVPVKGRVNFRMEEGMAVGFWSQVDNVKSDIYQEAKNGAELQKPIISLQYKFTEGQDVLTFQEAPPYLNDLAAIFDALLNYPMRQ